MFKLLENLENIPTETALHELSFYYINSNEEDKNKIIDYLLDLEDSPIKTIYLKTISILGNQEITSYFDDNEIKQQVSKSLNNINYFNKNKTTENALILLKKNLNSIGDSIIEDNINEFNSLAILIKSKFRLTDNSLLYDNKEIIDFFKQGIILHDRESNNINIIITKATNITMIFCINKTINLYDNELNLLSIEKDKIILKDNLISEYILAISEIFNRFLVNKYNRLKG